MTRYQALAHAPERHRVFVGWNEFIQTFFIEVVDVEIAEFNIGIMGRMDDFTADYPEWHRLGAALENDVVLYRGTVVGEMLDLVKLGTHLQPYGSFGPNQVRWLLRDQALANCPTTMQTRIGNLIRATARNCSMIRTNEDA